MVFDDCGDRTDEVDFCSEDWSLLGMARTWFVCDLQKELIPFAYRCNGRFDCLDRTDEKDCKDCSEGFTSCS
ncbi:hypothetical protein BaRGS_00019354, partial [Batillaria attramentaria]